MEKILWNLNECAYCGKYMKDPEGEGAVYVTITGTCPNCGTKNRDDDYTFYACRVCHYLLNEVTEETDEDLIEFKFLNPGETRAKKIKELEEAFEKRTERTSPCG